MGTCFGFGSSDGVGVGVTFGVDAGNGVNAAVGADVGAGVAVGIDAGVGMGVCVVVAYHVANSASSLGSVIVCLSPSYRKQKRASPKSIVISLSPEILPG